ncbi:hypothetical protein QTU68_002451 [Vibrio vulnificus]|nr:hypothetical protein [Vibrio parahaemolyticus]EHZ2899912.1 hypothetical protein [Vibrio vulnificus]EIA1334832.1 hypothetical protein [Vibrio vulnificus]EIV8607497.1 hypothetical protein [Vibrio vulnificus]EIX4867690.1 hypothetical protein [Vibrio vulnificus]
MASLIDNKVKTASRRADMIQEILASLSKSNASFKSARKLSEFVAEKMQEKGEPIDSSTLRRKGSQYKELIDNFIGKGAYQSEHAANITKDLKLRKQNKRVTELEALLKKKERELADKETEIEVLLINRHNERSSGLATIAPPKASTYKKSELDEAHSVLQEQLKDLELLQRQLDLACKTINKMMKDASESYVVEDGQFKDTLNADNPVMFHRGNLERYFLLYHTE